MKLYLKLNTIGLFRALENLLPKANSEVGEILRKLRDDDNYPDYQVNLESNQELMRQRESLFYEDAELPRLVSGLYFGSDTCEHLLPYPRHLAEVMAHCEKSKLHFVLVLPPLTPRYARHVEDSLAQLDQCNGEVVVNDFGALAIAARYKHLKITLGRLLNKVQRNAFIDRITPEDPSPQQWDNQQDALRQLEFAGADVRQFYKSLGIGRFGVDNGDYDFSFLSNSPRMNLDIYYPYRYLSSARACDSAGAIDQQRSFFPSEDCPRYCEKVAVSFPEGRWLGLLQRNNAFYKIDKHLDLPAAVTLNKRNRLIYEPML